MSYNPQTPCKCFRCEARLHECKKGLKTHIDNVEGFDEFETSYLYCIDCRLIVFHRQEHNLDELKYIYSNKRPKSQSIPISELEKIIKDLVNSLSGHKDRLKYEKFVEDLQALINKYKGEE